jgi:hypothetical protein
MADRLQQAPHLVVLALVEGQLQPRVLLGLQDADAVDGEHLALDADAAAQALERLRVRDAVDLGLVDARHLVAGMGDALRELAVVGEEDQAFGGHVQAPHRKQAGHGRNEVHHRRPLLRVEPRGHVPLGLVEQEVHGGGGRLHAHAVHADVVAGGVGLAAERLHRQPVDGDPALDDCRLGGAAGGDAGAREDLLEALFHDVMIPRPLGGAGRRGRAARGGG